MKNIGEQFQQATSYRRDEAPAPSRSYSAPPMPYKEYPNAPTIQLPAWQPGPALPLPRLLAARRTIRRYSEDKPLSLAHLSFILWAANGITHRDGRYEFRTAPSAGALYPIETYLFAHRVTDLEPGLYHYRVKGHLLESIAPGDHADKLAAAALGQTICARAAAVLAWTAVFPRSAVKYGQRAYRYVYLDAGHVAQNTLLAATSLALAACPVAALLDDEVNNLLNIDGHEEAILYMTTLAHPST